MALWDRVKGLLHGSNNVAGSVDFVERHMKRIREVSEMERANQLEGSFRTSLGKALLFLPRDYQFTELVMKTLEEGLGEHPDLGTFANRPNATNTLLYVLPDWNQTIHLEMRGYCILITGRTFGDERYKKATANARSLMSKVRDSVLPKRMTPRDQNFGENVRWESYFSPKEGFNPQELVWRAIGRKLSKRGLVLPEYMKN